MPEAPPNRVSDILGRIVPRPSATPAPVPAPAPAPRPAPPKKANPRKVDSDGDGVVDYYDRSPGLASDKRWNHRAAQEYSLFVKRRAYELQQKGVEIDCADFAVKLLEDFCQEKGLPNPFAGIGKWSTYTPQSPGGLPNVNGPNFFRSGMHAENLAREFTRRVNDSDQDGKAGYDDAWGHVDIADLRPGDLLFYDWDDDGKVNHTINVIDVAQDGTVTIAYGTYDNLNGENKPLTWNALDLSPIQIEVLTPGTGDYLKWLGPFNHLWGARRFNMLPDMVKQNPVEAPPVPETPTPLAPETPGTTTRPHRLDLARRPLSLIA